jgi:glycosyltransferase involved in cell wall biosynthesis
VGKLKPVISQIITFHSEGVLAHLTLASMKRVREHAACRKIPIEFVLSLDRADELTTQIVKKHPLITASDQIIELDHGDLASSRNSAVKVARGEYIGTMDGDDYYSANWATAALQRIESAKTPAVVHPEFCISFGAIHSVARVIDMDKDKFPLAACLTLHPWISCSFGIREIYVDNPYLPTNVKETGFGYEDWHWNLELVAHGIKHVCAPQTALFYRRKAESMLTTMTSAAAIIRPSAFFNKMTPWVDENKKNHDD